MKRVFIFLLPFLVGCTTIKRYKSVAETKTDNENMVTIDLFGTKMDAAKEEDPSKSLWDLQAEGQAELIKAMDKRNSEDEKFISSLNGKYLKPAEKALTDYTTKDLKLIFSIGKTRDYLNIGSSTKPFTLADRIEYLKFDMTVDNSLNLNFIKWNKFTTEYATVDIEDVTFAQTAEVGGSYGISNTSGSEQTVDNEKTTTSRSLTPSVNAKGTLSKTEVQKVRYRYVSLNGKISDKSISIEQEGMREIDLSGNVIADVQLKFDESPVVLSTGEGYKAKDGSYNDFKNVKLSQYQVMIPEITGMPEEIDATLNYIYAYRRVSKGEKTFYEWDDEIQYLKGTASKKITLFKKKDYLPKFYNVSMIGEDMVAPDRRTRLIAEDNVNNEATELIFPSLAAAQEFYTWLSRLDRAGGDPNQPIILGGYIIKIRRNNTDTVLMKSNLTTEIRKLQPLLYYRNIPKKEESK